jgi:predicted phosphodiesterase
MQKYLFITDVHWGYEYDKQRHKRPIHDVRAVGAMLSFARDFKPDVVILGGDILDCGAISHHNQRKPGNVEGLRLARDLAECRDALIRPLEALGAKKYYYIVGNHEDWLNDAVIETPALEGLIDLKGDLLTAPFSRPDESPWEIIPQGGGVKLGKLYFMHGDTLKTGGEHVAKIAHNYYGRCVRFGHFHTYQVHTPRTALDSDIKHTSVCVPCLCRKDPTYNDGKPNAWMQGFNYGYVNKNGTFSDYVVVMVDGKFTAGGKTYGEGRS